MVEFINECSMVLRSTIHDGFPQAPIQFMLCGRQALVSCPDEEMKYAAKISFEDNLDWSKNKDEVISKIYEMENKRVHNNVKSYYEELMSASTFKKKIYRYVDDNMDNKKHTRLEQYQG